MIKILRAEEGAPVPGGRDFSGVIEKIAAAAEGPLTLRFLPGVYHFYPDTLPARTLYMSNTDSARYPRKRCGLYLEGKKDVSFTGEGALFLFHGPLTALAFVDCENIVFSGIDIDYACPSTIDLTIVETAEAGGKTSAAAAYPGGYECEVAGAALVFHGEKSPRTGESYWRLKTGDPGLLSQRYEAKTGRVYRTREDLLYRAETLAAPGPGRIEIRYDRPRDLAPGDCFQMRDTKRDGCGIFMERCKNIRFESLRIGYLYSFGALAQCSEDISYEAVSFRPWKPGRMTGAAADNIHFSNCRGMLIVRNCDFFNPHDDPVNIHGVFLRVESSGGRRVILKFMHPQTFGFPCVFPGDEIWFYDSLKLLPLGAPRRVLAVEGPSEEDPYRIAVSLDEEPGLPEGRPIAAENRSWIPRALIAGNRFEQIPTRGLLVSTGGEVVVRDNFFVRTRMSGIYISGDARDWFESGPVRDVLIENNIFQDCGGKAVWVEPTNTEFSGEGGEKVHRNISIKGNVIKGVGFPALSIKSSAGVHIENNLIENTRRDGADCIENIDSEIEAAGNIVY